MGRKRNKLQGQIFSFIIFFLFTNISFGQTINGVIKDQFQDIALKIWDHAELGYQENQSSELLADALEKEGFKIKRGVAGIPTAFTAEYGSGGPVIGILGEFDALPGLAQTSSPFKEIANNTSGGGHAWPPLIWSFFSLG